MDSYSYFASHFGWVTAEDHFIGGQYFYLFIYIVIIVSLTVTDVINTHYGIKRREEKCAVHRAGAANEPCYIRNCPAKGFCIHHKPLTFRERLSRFFLKFQKKKP